MDARQMIMDRLQQLGADGLCNQDCGCAREDLAPCGDGPFPDCVAARRILWSHARLLEYTDEKPLHPDDHYFIPLRIDSGSEEGTTGKTTEGE